MILKGYNQKRRFQFEKQLDAMDCGPSCLKMISSYYGKKYSLDYLRAYCFIGRDGVSLFAISKAAEKIGFRTTGGKFTFDSLLKYWRSPAIVHWDQNHFVVVYKIKKRKKGVIIYIADPGLGLTQYSQDDFLQHWLSSKTNGLEKGVVLLLEPGPDFLVSGKQSQDGKESRLKFLYKYFKQFRKLFAQLILGLIVGSILLLIFPLLTQAIVDVGVKNQDLKLIWIILLAQLSLLLGRTSIDFVRRRILLHTSTRINLSLISDFFIKLMKLPMSYFDTKLLGDLLQRIEDHSRIERFLTAQTLNLMFSITNVIIFGIVLIFYNPTIFLIFLIGSTIYAVWILLFLQKRRGLDYRNFEQQALNRSRIYEMLNGMQEIKLQGCEQRKRWEWEDVQADLFKVNLESLSLQQKQEGGSVCINELKNILITVFAAMAVIKGELTLGMMLSVQYIIGQLNSPVEQIMNFVYQWQDVSISLERMNEVHCKKEEENSTRSISSFNQFSNDDIILNDVTFQYGGPSSAKVLDGISLCIPAGKVTAIVGTSGSGKSTLIKLLLGYYPATSGVITVGGHGVNHLNLLWWRAQCGVVMQDGFIFSDTIARNVATSDLEIDKLLLLKSLAVANIKDYVTELPLSINTIIGNEGQGISHGQRQRILIARAVYKNPQYIFLDEATNSLDTNNEKIIVQNLNEFYKNKTVVVVAHRLSTVRNADQIVVLDKGHIVETGGHEKLVSLKGHYFNLVKNQLELGA